MPFAEPQLGLVVRYAYLWRDEAARGREEGGKDHPCVILTIRRRGDDLVVTVAPITHRPPTATDHAVELPTATKRRLGLDEQRSWIVTNDLNRFVWPGPDLRPLPSRPSTFAYGLIPAGLYELVRQSVLAHIGKARALVSKRTE